MVGKWLLTDCSSGFGQRVQSQDIAWQATDRKDIQPHQETTHQRPCSHDVVGGWAGDCVGEVHPVVGIDVFEFGPDATDLHCGAVVGRMVGFRFVGC
jgi:hypothetical protein